ncbi:TipC family immunity protein [Listeria goaensis]|uniref:TipC family immunity protein n=1 Tax=Listeria goaensis TaxID=1649188 RepID=UPI000B5883F6|nr:TipC family immunity protein [Listeria goaensis]
MEKRTKIIAIVVLLLMIVVAFVLTKNITQNMKAKNIFDEIFYDEREALDKSFLTPGNGVASLAKVEGMEQWNRAGANNIEVLPFTEMYMKSALPDKVKKLYYIFSFSEEGEDKGKLIMVILYQFGDKLFAEIGYSYDVKTKVLTEGIRVQDDKQVIAKDKDEIEKYFIDNGTSLKEMEQLGDEILKDKMLTDWCSVYNSRFSPDDFGDVKVKKTY